MTTTTCAVESSIRSNADNQYCGITSQWYKDNLPKDPAVTTKYLTQCKQCDTLNDGDAYKKECYRTANDILVQQDATRGSGGFASPQSGFDFDYGRVVDTLYSPTATGANPNGSLSNVVLNAQRLGNVVAATLIAPIPSASTVPNAMPCKNGPQGTGCRMVKAMSQEQNGALSDPKYASSYSIHVGYCPRKDKATKEECATDPNLLWSDVLGACQQKRYALIDNSPRSFVDGSKMTGLIPTIAADMKVFSPENTYAALTGQSIENAFRLDPCPEGFRVGSTSNLSSFIPRENIVMMIIVILIIVILILNLNTSGRYCGSSVNDFGRR
jgi:hypothetical protein